MTHINQRRDLAINWAGANPILQDGEVGWEKDTRKSKLGDGVTRWNDLPYTGSTPTKADLGLDQVDNTRDADKPISTAADTRFTSAENWLQTHETWLGDLDDGLSSEVTNRTDDVARARAKRWLSSAAYSVGAVVGHNGSLWRCKVATTAGQVPSLFTSKWERVAGGNPDMIPLGDPYMNGDSLDNWSTFWKTGTVNAIALTTAASTLDTGRQSVLLDMSASATQRLYPQDEFMCTGGETVQMTVRAKLLVAPTSGNATIAGDLTQSDVGVPEPFGAGAVAQAAYEGTQTLTTSWATYTFTFLTTNGKPRGKMAPIIAMPSTGGGQVVIAWIKQKKIGDSGVIEGVLIPIGSGGSSYGSGWSDYGSGWPGGAFQRNGDTVRLEGLIKGTSGTILTLPAGYRPRRRMLMRVPIASGSGRIDINTDGTITYGGEVTTGGSPTSYLSLSGIDIPVLPL